MDKTVTPNEDLNECLKLYHQTLLNNFVVLGIASDLKNAQNLFPYSIFENQFHWSFLDLARVVIADHWKSITPIILKEREDRFTFNSYNKSLNVAL
eukprot:Pgem_evm1s14480